MRAAKPEDIALMALKDAGYDSFRALAMRVAADPELYLSNDDGKVAGKLGLPVELWRQVQTLDEYRQEQTVAVIYQNAGKPRDVQRVVAKLLQIAADPEDEANALAAQRIYYSLLSKVGALPREEKAPLIGVQGHVLLMNHPSPQEVVPIGDVRTGEAALEPGKTGAEKGHEPEKGSGNRSN